MYPATEETSKHRRRNTILIERQRRQSGKRAEERRENQSQQYSQKLHQCKPCAISWSFSVATQPGMYLGKTESPVWLKDLFSLTEMR